MDENTLYAHGGISPGSEKNGPLGYITIRIIVSALPDRKKPDL